MAKFISVLDTHLGLSFWQAVQWDDDLDALMSNPLYTAGVNLSLPKNAGDRRVETKTITETSTQLQASATVIQLSTRGQNLLAVAKGNATDRMIERLDQSND